MRSSTPKVLVIIPTLNSWNTLRSCVVSLYEQTLLPTEILVVDNGSTDGTSSKVKIFFPRVKLITLDRNTGVTGGRNAGISAANKKGGYLLFFDHDMVAEKNMVENLVEVAEMDKSYGIITPKIYYLEDKKRVWAAGTNINLWTGQVLFRGGKDMGQFEKIEEVQVAPAALLVKKQVISRIGKFDERYFLTYEDTDLCFRAKRKGYKTIYVPKAIAYHQLSLLKTDDRKRLLSRAFYVARNRVLFMKDFGKNFYLFLLFSPVYLFYFGVMAIIEKDFKSFNNFLKGYLRGITEGFKL